MADNFYLRLPPTPHSKSPDMPGLPEHFENLFLNGNFAEEDIDNNNVAAGANRNLEDNTHCWVFGYGSLCWYPGFEYNKCITGYIRGYNRRFWQGNTTHRGTVDKVSFNVVFFPEILYFILICKPQMNKSLRYLHKLNYIKNIHM